MTHPGDHRRDSRVRALFDDVIELKPEERLQRLRRLCGEDEKLYDEVRSLIEWDARHDGILDRPFPAEIASSLRSSQAPDAHQPPTAIGPYEIESVLGIGGMGVVYSARQRAPVDRRVALKVIRRAVDTDEARRRFALEQQALALMSHPAIATVFDAGVTDDGCPYFAMEYISGLSITQYCDHAVLGLEERVEVLLKVCGAVHHAHQKGVIHRDIKASNVIVADSDEGPTPKIIDFGVARASNPTLNPTDRRISWFGSLLGTPETMSPEQLELGPHHVDTRADIYSLGVMLYELIVGETPYTFSDTEEIDDIRRTICEQPSPTPSAVLAAKSQPEIEAIAAARNTTARELLNSTQPELDCIVAKTLEKDRDDRYSTVAELAEDLGRWLRGEVVSAHPPRWSYRLRKLTSRHRTLSVAVMIALAGLGIGLALATKSYLEANSARRRADTLLSDYRSLVDGALLEELRQEGDRLWPAWPERIADMKGWVERANALVERRDQHLARLRALDGDSPSTGWTADVVAGPKRMAELERVIASFDEYIAAAEEPGRTVTGNTLWFLGRKRQQVREELARYQHRVARNQGDTTGISQAEDPWLRRQLASLVQQIDVFNDEYLVPGTANSLIDRIARAKSTRAQSLGPRTVAWREAAARIADKLKNPHYDGLYLVPQHGIVPLGPNPLSGLWEFWVSETGTMPQIRSDGGYDMTSDTGMILVLVPGGAFFMGAQNRDRSARNYDPFAWQHEAPVHEVTLEPFFISKYEMTRGQWIRLSGTDPRLVKPPIESDTETRRLQNRLPVNQVYWEPSRQVLRRAGLLLPSEAQWEFAARGGSQRPRHFGSDVSKLGRFANLRDRSKLMQDRAQHERQIISKYEVEFDDRFPALAPVGSFASNPFGLYDVFGNVCEWCADWFQVYYCPVEPGTGLRVPADEGPKLRVVRGGSFDSLAGVARSTSRIHVVPATADIGIGLRPVRPIITTEGDLAVFRWDQ